LASSRFNESEARCDPVNPRTVNHFRLTSPEISGKFAVFAQKAPLAQLAEQGTLNPKVEGSIPSRCTVASGVSFSSVSVVVSACAPVAQLDRASDYGSEGREFESLRAHLLGNAPVAELVDALDSGSSGRKPVEVRVLSGAFVVGSDRRFSTLGRAKVLFGGLGRAASNRFVGWGSSGTWDTPRCWNW